MKKKGFRQQQIIGELRETQVLCGQGSTEGDMRRKLGIREQTYYRWRRECGGWGWIRLGSSRRWRGKLLSPSRRRQAVIQVYKELEVSQRGGMQGTWAGPIESASLTERPMEITSAS